ncbi:MAG: 2-oxo acid dehydrogenase subunit E2 [Methylococcales bacterium]|nr:2-oxo acid dehydrogenase subunit E2 [Methylococcales bacterium]
MSYFNLPDLGEGLQEAEIIEWFVGNGDKVKQDDILLSVETAKAIVDLPSPEDGIIQQVYGAAGDIIQVGDPLVEFVSETEAKHDAGSVVGEVKVGDTLITEAPLSVSHPTSTGFKATPAVRALATRLNVDLAMVKPSGKNNTITADDLKRVAKLIKESGEMIPLTGARRTMALTMSQAHSEAVPVTINDDADIDGWDKKSDMTMRLIRAIATACKAEPALNAWYDNHAVARIFIDKVDLGIAVDTEQGLFVPVLSHVANREIEDLRKGLNEIKEAVKARSIPPEKMRGHTITLSKFGTFAGRYASPVIVPPTVAIVGAGKIRAQVVMVNDQVESHEILPLSLTFDHRAVTGGEAARFLAALLKDLELSE